MLEWQSFAGSLIPEAGVRVAVLWFDPLLQWYLIDGASIPGTCVHGLAVFCAISLHHASTLTPVSPAGMQSWRSTGGSTLTWTSSGRRPLDFLRRYPLVLPATRPVGFSNDFLAAAPRHPLMLQMLQALPAWSLPLITKYPTVMFSTGPMFVTLQVWPYLLLQSFKPLGVLHRLGEARGQMLDAWLMPAPAVRPYLQSCQIVARLPAHQL